MTKTILVLAANPKDTPRLRLDEEVREISNGLQRAKRRDEFILNSILAARSSEVRRAMLDLKPNIVHFCGHGMGTEGIAFEDNYGQAKVVETKAIMGLFELFARDVNCVILNACYSEAQADAIVQHIDYVIGMSKEIGDMAAIEFVTAFYDALGAGDSIEFAHKLGCNAIQWLGVSEEKTPVLKLRTNISTKPSTYLAEPASFENTSPLHSGDLPSQEYYDVFISHASEDKDSFVRSLAGDLSRLGFHVWYDEFELKIGDSLRETVDKGLVNSKYGIVVLSKSFLDKNWPKHELNGLFAREVEGRKVILPIWHNIIKADILRYSPILADKFALSSNNMSMDELVQALALVLKA